MNLLKTLTVGLVAAALPSMAFANPDPTIVHICGSTAFRAPVTCAIINALGGTGCKAACNKSGTAPGNQNLLGGQAAIFANGTVSYSGSTFTGNATIIVLANWTGSLAGILDVAAQNATLTYPNPADAAVEASMQACDISPFGGGGTLPSSPAFSTVAAAPEVCMTDSFASSAAAALASAQVTAGHNIGGATTGAGLKTLVNGAGLIEAGSASTNIVGKGSSTGYLGIVPFQWCIGNLSGATFAAPTNITQQTANYIIKNGAAPLSMFNTTSTGTLSGADFVYLVGRNEDSGTRIAAFAEPQLSFSVNPQQYLLTFSGGNKTGDIPAPTDFSFIGASTGTGAFVTGFDAWPQGATLNTEPFIHWTNAGFGHGGYAGGGDVSSVLSTPVNQSFPDPNGAALAGENTGKAFFIGYLGIADSGSFGNATKIIGGAALAYNGVTPSLAGINNGSYSFWSYEHMYYIGSGTHIVPGAIKTFADNLADSLANVYVSYGSGGVVTTTSPAGVALLPQNTVGSVTRSVEGGGYTLNY